MRKDRIITRNWKHQSSFGANKHKWAASGYYNMGELLYSSLE